MNFSVVLTQQQEKVYASGTQKHQLGQPRLVGPVLSRRKNITIQL